MIKWDNKAKERLYKAIRAKMDQKNWVRKDWRDLRDRPHALLTRYLGKFGVKEVHRAESSDRTIKCWVVGWRAPHWDGSGDARSSRHVIIPHPNYGSEYPKGLWKDMKGLKIPKDVAEKFLVLGMP